MRKIPFSYALASLLVLVLVLWLAFGNFQRFQTSAPEASPRNDTGPRVEIALQQSTPFIPQQIIQGQLTAERETTLRANVAGFVAEKPVAQGSRVEAGDRLLVLDNDALPEQLKQAQDELAVAEAEYAGARNLRQRELISQPELLRLQSSLSASAASVAQLQKQLDDSRPTAPFDGVIDRVQVEVGDLLQPGEEWAQLVDDRRLKGIAWVSQQQVGDLSEGLPVTARLLNGDHLEGELTFISHRAEEATRTFYIEATLDNPAGKRLAGGSAELTITLPPRQVHTLSPALLSLNSEGQLAVKHLDENDQVQQTAVELVSADIQRAYVTGLPDPLRLITLGAGMVDAGETVTPVPVEDAIISQSQAGQDSVHAPVD
ncbi:MULTISPECIES: efflux RND transporter periplasmic adaptor subunit [Halomonadaceae]|uniref:Efflux RND transporter periplasmic adaptor subunit n=2 Tax=Vreelandella TaxID=3137766 RepID=A0A7Z0S021_9GAMM|nr:MULTISPECIES: efflux RND transporter periplasmic adaptor subunit [Halomonas]NYS79860.1 efflux RND transporter periplasmic adaptor subunit [Halomonas glaciei]|tara:strand:+ start:211 stop:1332 length:1122 start_codon:yes stop_codon:yes gene_type:complete